MTFARLRRHSFVPLYQQIRNDIASQITDGALAPGTTLPSEAELASAYGVGRPTVRQAIDTLRREGFATTVRGSGTFVSEQIGQISLLSFDGLTRSLRARGIEPTDAVVGEEAGDLPFDVLTVDRPSATWWVVKRIRSFDTPSGRQPFCVETDAFNVDLCPDAAAMFRDTGSASAVLDDGYGFTISRCDVASYALDANSADVVDHLGLDRRDPVLVMERLNWSVANEPLHGVRFIVATLKVPIVERLINPIAGQGGGIG